MFYIIFFDLFRCDFVPKFVFGKMNRYAEHEKRPLANHHLSVDCVVIDFDGKQLKVLLINRAGEDNGEVYHDMKLPGSLIYVDEDLDEAAKRVLFELTGLKSVKLVQFKAFGSKDRTSNPRDVLWLEQTMQLKVERIVTIAYPVVNQDRPYAG